MAMLTAALLLDGGQTPIPKAPALDDPVSLSLFDLAADAQLQDQPFTCVREGSMPEIKMCAAEDMARETERMQRYLEAARTRANALDEVSVEYGPRTRQAAWLSESQQAWDLYAERRCEGVHEATSGGTMGSLGYMGCVIEATRQRTHDIWSDYLTYWDTTPPILPEPVLTVAAEDGGAEAP